MIERPGSSGPVTIQVRDNGAGMLLIMYKTAMKANYIEVVDDLMI